VIALLAAAVLAAAVTGAPAAPVLPAPALAAAPALPAATAPALPPAAVVLKYQAALKRLKEPRVFAVQYRMEQTGTRTLEQTHRIFRSGKDERDETLAVNGNRSKKPVVRIFRNRPYRYTVAALAPKPSAYDFVYAGPHRNGKHDDYVFDLVPNGKPPAFAFTQVTIDGVTFLPQSVSFATRQHGGQGAVTFAKADRYWVARSASAQAEMPGGLAHEQIAFTDWRFPPSLPASTFAMPRPLPTPPPALP
jgi:hypothetical protein